MNGTAWFRKSPATSADAESGIAEYQYAVGTSPGADNVQGWTAAAQATAEFGFTVT
jgi:hypothetical protein